MAEKNATSSNISYDNPQSLPEIVVTATREELEPFPNVRENILDQFASYSTLWTMACLTTEQFNNPLSYRNNDEALDNVIFSSGGYLGEKRSITTGGIPEYFVDNFEFNTLLPGGAGVGQTSVHPISFEVYEPYSLGLFFESLRVSAYKANHPNHLQAPYLLKLDIIGYNDEGQVFKSTGLTRYFVIKLLSVEFNAKESGTVYQVKAIPYSELAFTSIFDTLLAETTLSGETVGEVLLTGTQSLSTVLTQQSQKRAKRQTGAGIPDKYVIEFGDYQKTTEIFNRTSTLEKSATIDLAQPKSKKVGSSASASTTEPTKNDIEKASMGWSISKGGNYEFSLPNESFKDGVLQRRNIKINSKNRLLTFPQGTKITDVITEIILSSSYCYETLKAENIDNKGMVNWFKIDVQIKLENTIDPVRNEIPKTFYFRVLPYKIHSSIFKKIVAPAFGITELSKDIVKKYDYIFTGNNTQILNLDFKVNTSLYAGLRNQAAEDTSGNNQALTSGQAVPVPETLNPAYTDKNALANKTGNKSGTAMPSTLDLPSHGAGAVDSPEILVAREFAAAIRDSVIELVNLDLDILGDPYFLSDNGLANYYSDPVTDQLTADGTWWDGSQPFVYVAIRTPVDVDTDSYLYRFLEDEEFSVSPYSGVYRVIRIENNFQNNLFKQKLILVRVPGQPDEYDYPISDPPKQEILATEESGTINPADSSRVDKWEPGPTVKNPFALQNGVLNENMRRALNENKATSGTSPSRRQASSFPRLGESSPLTEYLRNTNPNRVNGLTADDVNLLFKTFNEKK